MPHYRVLVNGRNFRISIDGKSKRVGFYTTRFVEASSFQQAENIVIEGLSADPHLINVTQNKPGDSPALFVDDIDEVDSLEPAIGFAFYDEEE